MMVSLHEIIKTVIVFLFVLLGAMIGSYLGKRYANKEDVKNKESLEDEIISHY